MDADRYPDANARASKRFGIMFKSLSIQSPRPNGTQSIESGVTDLSTTEEDLMDVLCLTQPDDPCIMPAPIEELRPHAKRILSSSSPYACSSIPRGDFMSLLKLLLSVQLDKPEWGSHEPYFHTGRILTHPDSEILQGAADALLKRFTTNEKSDIEWHVVKNVLSVYLVRSLCNTKNRVASLISRPKARFRLSISSHLHKLPLTIKFDRRSPQSFHIKLHHPCPVRTISQPIPTPSAGPSETPCLRRLRPSKFPLCSSNHSDRIFIFTS